MDYEVEGERPKGSQKT